MNCVLHLTVEKKKKIQCPLVIILYKGNTVSKNKLSFKSFNRDRGVTIYNTISMTTEQLSPLKKEMRCG